MVVFSVNVSAASDNLINEDLRQWEQLETLNELKVYKTGDVYRLSGSGNGFVGAVYDLPSFTAGHSYTLSFRIPAGSDIASAFNTTWSDENTIAQMNNCVVSVGYGFLKPDGSLIDTHVDLYEFNSSNISRYVGRNLKTTFVAGSASGRPVVYILVGINDSTSSKMHHFYFSDFVLIDNDDNSKELTGIRGFLHSIRWDLVGGTCEEDDCPHSSDVNPHLSLTERMTAGFSSLLDKIGNKFEEGSTLNTWFLNLSSGVSKLGDRIDLFFENLKKSITAKFDEIIQLLKDSINSLKLKFEEVGKSIEKKFQDISDKFTEFFDKFKPRVYEEFVWKRGIVNWSTGDVTFRDDNYPYVIVSDMFTVAPGTKYLVDFVCTSDTKGLAIFQYDYYGNFIGNLYATSSSFEKYELPSGFQYRFRSQYPPGDADLSVMNDYVLVYADEGWINAFVHKIEFTIKKLFIPSDSYIENWKNSLTDTMSSHLGFIWTSLDFVGDFFLNLKDLLSGYTSDDVPVFTLPEIEFELLGKHFHLWDELTIKLDFLSTGIFSYLYGLYKIILYVILIFCLLKYGVTVYEKVVFQ